MNCKIAGFGESVVDFIPVDDGKNAGDGCITYKACPGGSVANFCVVTARQGIESVFIGGVGDDSFGRFLRERIADFHVDSSSMILTSECGTNLTFVDLKENGQREYSFVNQPGADKMVDYEQIDTQKIFDCRLLHVSSNAMIWGKTRKSQPRLMEEAKKRGLMISYDVNYRANYYRTREEALEILRTPLEWADIVKVTEEELEFLTGARTVEAARSLMEYGAGLILVTEGEGGSSFILPDCEGRVSACRVPVVDTTGAGDCFLGGFLSWMLLHGDLRHMTERDVFEASVYANKAAALSIQRTGAMSSVPTREEVESFKESITGK